MSADNVFTPKPLTAPEYVRALFNSSDNVAVLVRNRMTANTIQRIAKSDVIADPQFQSWLKSQNVFGSDIFVGMNPIKDGACNRSKDCIKEIRHLYLDLDANGDQALNGIRNSSEIPPPNFVLDTSPGKHQVVWTVGGMGMEEAESLLRRMAAQFGGDPAATDATRVLRLPGFANRKLSEEFIVQVRHEADAVYAMRDFAVEGESLETPRYIGDTLAGFTRTPVHKSQSERDWAYAKRALARGDGPEEVIRRIADFRADHKAEPTYYARLTVAKAQNELNATRNKSDTAAGGPGDAENLPDRGA